MGSPKCVDRIFLGTLDARLIALDAATGEPCADFGVRGSVDLTQNVDYRLGDADRITSPPTVIGDVVVVGSSIGDNARVDMELGDVRGSTLAAENCSGRGSQCLGPKDKSCARAPEIPGA
jgi:glucose dehydrogenase